MCGANTVLMCRVALPVTNCKSIYFGSVIAGSFDCGLTLATILADDLGVMCEVAAGIPVPGAVMADTAPFDFCFVQFVLAGAIQIARIAQVPSGDAGIATALVALRVAAFDLRDIPVLADLPLVVVQVNPVMVNVALVGTHFINVAANRRVIGPDLIDR